MIMFRLRSQDTEAGRVDVIMGDTADENEFLHRVFVGNITKFVLITKPAQQNKKTYFPCHATTSKGVCSWWQACSWPDSLHIINIEIPDEVKIVLTCKQPPTDFGQCRSKLPESRNLYDWLNRSHLKLQVRVIQGVNQKFLVYLMVKKWEKSSIRTRGTTHIHGMDHQEEWPWISFHAESHIARPA